MHFRLMLFLLSCCACLTLTNSDKNQIDKMIFDEIEILSDIITNYFKTYYSDQQLFISIILAPSIAYYGFHDDFFDKLFDDPALPEFPHNILNRMDATSRDHTNAFNIILIDNSKSLT